jgi:membrane protease YdiL (CAAX protease family)
MDRVQAFLEVLLLSGLVSSFVAALAVAAFLRNGTDLLATNAATIVSFLLLESAILLLLLFMVLKAHGETILSLGFDWSRWKPEVLMGCALVPLLLLINTLIALFFRSFLPGYHLETNPLLEIIQTPRQLGLFLLAVLVAGGIKEELQRAFILIRFQRHLGGAVAGLIIWSLVFGAGHHVQGMQGITVATLYGFIFGVIYLLRRSLIAPIVAHGMYDVTVLMMFWYSSGR